MFTPAQIVEIEFKSGQVVTLEMTEQLVKSVREAFSLSEFFMPTPEQVRLYLIESMKNAEKTLADEEV